jgi:hypothetical protein
MRRDPTPLLLGLGLFLIYTANGRPIGAGDVVPATLLPVALLRGDGPVLDRFEAVLRTSDGRLPGYVEEARGHIVSRYPIGPALIAAPFVLPQLAVLDRLDPDWERDRSRVRPRCAQMGKNAAAAIVALSAVVMLSVLRRIGLRRVALPAAAIVALGSDSAAVAAQAPWQHGPAELCLATAMLLLIGGRSPARLALAGLATALVVVCRPIDLVYAAAVALWVLFHHDRPRRWAFFGPAGAAAVALAGYHLWFFDTLTGGYAAIEQMHPWAHGTRGTWTAPLLEGASGTLFSPSHGLFVYCPWVPLALGMLLWIRFRGERFFLLPQGGGDGSRVGESLSTYLLVSLVPSFVLLAKYSCWWGGHCFGPRFWIDANPIFTVALAAALEWARLRCRPGLLALTAAAAWAVAVQAVGMLCYPSSWHGSPVNADRHHERLWDWSDSELTRCLREGIRPRAW